VRVSGWVGEPGAASLTFSRDSAYTISTGRPGPCRRPSPHHSVAAEPSLSAKAVGSAAGTRAGPSAAGRVSRRSLLKLALPPTPSRCCLISWLLRAAWMQQQQHIERNADLPRVNSLATNGWPYSICNHSSVA